MASSILTPLGRESRLPMLTWLAMGIIRSPLLQLAEINFWNAQPTVKVAEAKTLWVRIMPTELHDVHQRWCIDAKCEWVYQGLLNRTERRLLEVVVRDFDPDGASL
ncbi:hypothetical protein GB937_007191 [Aspergillus fischeri]|nr:hypothetical protein GB937_007191 [Aspergillus fischeri]